MAPLLHRPSSPTTPIIANKRQRSPRNRPHPHSSTESNSHVDCLQQSLKKVRLSSSPGELRLQKDLRHLVMHRHWKLSTSCDGTLYQAPHANVRLWVDDKDPLQLALDLQNQVRVRLHVPPLYPHRPPVVQQVQGHARIQHVVVLGGGECPKSMPSQTLVFDQWNAISQLDQFIDFLCTRLATTAPQLDASSHRGSSTSLHLPVQEPHLPLNRFDQGYEKQQGDCLGLFMDES